MTANPLVGTWRLVSFEMRDVDGRMAVQFGRANRPRLDVGDLLAGADAEIVAAARDYIAYCGTYEFHDDEVRHRVELSLMPNWIGGEMVRLVALDGDIVTLATPPVPVGGRQQVATLVWQRMGGQVSATRAKAPTRPHPGRLASTITVDALVESLKSRRTAAPRARRPRPRAGCPTASPARLGDG